MNCAIAGRHGHSGMMPRFLAALFAATTLVACIHLAPAQTNGDHSMTHQTIDKPIYIAGYSIRTRNADEMGGHGKIGPLWQRFRQQNLAAQIPHRADAALTVVYSGYESDQKGEYNYLLGARVDSVDALPDGMTWKRIEPGNYAVLLTEKGPMPGILQDAWARIWQMPPSTLGGNRAFHTDYEIYDERSADPSNGQVEIHIGLQP
jgi:predicted transcriptional regulator YdeE